MALMMSSQFLSVQAPLGCYGINFSRTLRRSSPNQPPPPLRIRCTPCWKKFKFVAVVGNPAFATRSVEELQDAFGCQGLSFLNVGGGTIVADLKLENGCKARLVLRTARITSYKAHMWHGGEEELLYTVRSGRGKPTSDSLRGGINLGFVYSQDPLSCILPLSTECWRVENVRCEPSNYAQITLTASSNAAAEITGSNQGGLQFRYVVTLTDESLVSAVVVTNAGLQPVEFKGSIVNHLAVSSIEGAFAVGLNGCSYRSTPTQQFETLSEASDFFPPIWGAETNTRRDLPATSTTSLSESTDHVREFEDRGRWIVENEDYSPLKGGEARLYPTPPSSLTVLDRRLLLNLPHDARLTQLGFNVGSYWIGQGFRRSVVLQRLGFQEFWLSNPGPNSNLRDWQNFICLGPTQNTQSVVLLGKEKWRAAQILSNPGHG